MKQAEYIISRSYFTVVNLALLNCRQMIKLKPKKYENDFQISHTQAAQMMVKRLFISNLTHTTNIKYLASYENLL